MIAVTLFCVGAAWFGLKVRAAQHRAAEVARIRGMGGLVYYQYELLGTPLGCWNSAAKPPGPDALRNLLGVDFLADVAYIYAPSNAVNNSSRTPRLCDDDLKCVAEFTKLHLLVLDNDRITDAGVQGLGGLSELVQLSLANTGITDAALPTIGQLPSLKYLDLSGTKVTKSGIRSLRNLAKLKGLVLRGTQADELYHADIEAFAP